MFYPKKILLLSVPLLYLENWREMTTIYLLIDYWILRCQKSFAFVKHLARVPNASISIEINQNSYLTILSWSVHFGHVKQNQSIGPTILRYKVAVKKAKHQIGCFWVVFFTIWKYWVKMKKLSQRSRCLILPLPNSHTFCGIQICNWNFSAFTRKPVISRYSLLRAINMKLIWSRKHLFYPR